MDLESAIIQQLLSYTNLTALIGTRVYPVVAHQGVARPYVLIQRISTPRSYTMDSKAVVDSRIQAYVKADTYGGAKGVAEQVKSALQHKTGNIGTENKPYTILWCRLVNEIDTSEQDLVDDARTVFGQLLDFKVMYNE